MNFRGQFVLRSALAAMTAVMMLTGCAGATDEAGNGDQTDRTTNSAEATLPSFESPTEFGGAPVPITLEALNANLAGEFTSRFMMAGDRAYGVTPSGLGAVELETGETLWETNFPALSGDAPKSVFYKSEGPAAPVLSEDGATAYAAARVNIAGTGTTADQIAIQLIAVDTKTGELAWSVDIPRTDESDYEAGGNVEVVAVSDGVVVVSSIAGEDIITAAVDIATKKVLWTTVGVAKAVSEGVVVAVADPKKIEEFQLTGFELATGKILWPSESNNTKVFSSYVVMIETSTGDLITTRKKANEEKLVTQIIDPTSGEPTTTYSEGEIYNPQVSGEYLVDEYQGKISVYDPYRMKKLWGLPEENRIAPKDITTFGGLIYGRLGNGKSVIVDAKTGEDVSVDIPGTFVAVNEYGALMLRNRELVFVPATA